MYAYVNVFAERTMATSTLCAKYPASVTKETTRNNTTSSDLLQNDMFIQQNITETLLSFNGTIRTETSLENETSYTTMVLTAGYSIFLIQALIAITNNIFIFLAIYKNIELQCLNNAFIASLSAGDLLFGVGILIDCILYLGSDKNPVNFENHQARGKCMMVLWFMGVTFLVSLHSLLAIAVERYIKVVYSLRYYNIITKGRAVAAVTVIWVYSLASCCGLIATSRVQMSPTHNECAFYSLLSKFGYRYFITISTLALILVPLIHSRVFYIAYKHAKRIEDIQLALQSSSVTDFRIVKMVTLLIGVLYVLILPHFIVSYQISSNRFAGRPLLKTCSRMVSICLLLTNSCINPFIYHSRDPDFRKAFRKLLCKHST